MAGDPHPHHHGPPVHSHEYYRKDLGHLTEEEVWERQSRRSGLADHWWRLVDGRVGWRVLDVGSGPGFFSVEWARRVGPDGSVLALDLRDEPLAFLDKRRPHNVRTLRWDVEEQPLPEGGFDLIVATDILHHAERPGEVLARLRESGERLLVSEFDPDGPGEMGPPHGERITRPQMERLLREAGWEPWRWEDEPHEHYAVVSARRS